MTERLYDVTLDTGRARAPAPELEQEQRVAVFDLLEENRFTLPDAPQGPYALMLGRAGRKLDFRLSTQTGQDAAQFTLSLGPLNQVVKDYSHICESYYEAVRSKPPAEIEALDEARRAIHLEGAGMLREVLAGKAEIDGDTARRLFTLVCALTARD